jgi:N-acetylmuramoyl-L-alanine amidase
MTLRATLICLSFTLGLMTQAVLARSGPDGALKSVPPKAPVGQSFVVVIDAGHGGKDSGARGPRGTLEKDVTLAIARRLAALIQTQPGMRGVLVRKDDTFVGLRRRAEIARLSRADLFISLHADSFESSDIHGSSVFTLSETGATSEAARCLADRENAGEVGGVDLGAQEATVASVLVDLSKNATLEASDQAATRVLAALQKEFTLHNPKIQKAGFAVLKSLDVASLLIETAFISNPDEEARLLDPRHQERLARAIFTGIRAYAVSLGRLPIPAGKGKS